MPADDTVDVLRFARGLVFAAVCLVTTALGHSVISGDVPPGWALGLAFAGAFPVAWWLTGRERGARVVVGLTVLAQAALHLLFSLVHMLTCPPATADAAHGGMRMGAHQEMGMRAVAHGALHTGGPAPTGASAEASPVSTLPVLSAVTHGGDTRMLIAHLLAAALCGVWLWRGETAVHRTGRAAAALLSAPLFRACRALFGTTVRYTAEPLRAAPGCWEHQRPVASSWLRHAVIRRGPPQGRSTVGPSFSRSVVRRRTSVRGPVPA